MPGAGFIHQVIDELIKIASRRGNPPNKIIFFKNAVNQPKFGGHGRQI